MNIPPFIAGRKCRIIQQRGEKLNPLIMDRIHLGCHLERVATFPIKHAAGPVHENIVIATGYRGTI